MQSQLFMMKSKPLRASTLLPRNPWRCWAIHVVESHSFSWAMGFVLLANASLLGAQHWRQPDAFSSVIFYSNIIFTLAFVVECTLGIFGRGWNLYLKLGWNRFDLFVTVASVVDVVVAGFFSSLTSLTVFVSILRVARALRLVRLARR